MALIVICGGGGKTTLMQKYPDFFLDIDDFIWSYNTNYHDQLRYNKRFSSINANSDKSISILIFSIVCLY